MAPTARSEDRGRPTTAQWAKTYAQTLVSPAEWRCLDSLWQRESGWQADADNPASTAFGVAQLLGETSTDYRTQIRDGLDYIAHRYGTACAAWAHWQAKGWY